MSIFGLFKHNTNIIKKIDKSNSYSFDYQKNSYIFMLIGEVEMPSLPPSTHQYIKKRVT